MASNVSDDNKISNQSENIEKSDSNLSQEGSCKSSNKSTSKVSSNVKKNCNKLLVEKSWDPLYSSDWDSAGPPGPLASTRIKRDLSSLFKEPLPGIFAIPDERNFCLVHCLVLGPFETPYEGGFFHFAVRFGPSYPIHPPRVRLMTTGAGKVRFNPNLYSNGKVCLSILGTWTGPVWSPALNLGSLLLSIQSLLNDKPYYNEPGFKTERYYGESERYNQYLVHETIRVAVCGQLEEHYVDSKTTKLLPAELAEVMKESFLDLYDEYIETCQKYRRIDGQAMTDIFYVAANQNFSFSNLMKRLKKLKEKFSSDSTTEADKDKEVSSLSSISDEDGEYSKAEDPSTEAIIEEANEFVDEDSLEAAAGSSSIAEFPIDDDIALFFGDAEEEEELEDEGNGNKEIVHD